MGTGFAKKKKEAKLMQEQLAKLQESMTSKLESSEVEGSAGNGLVTIILTGTGEMKKVTIKKECVDPEDIEGLEALVKAAYQDGFKKVQELTNAQSPLGGNPLGTGMPDLSMFGF